MGLPRRLRLRSHRDVQRAQRKGRRASSSCLVVRYLRNDLQSPRFALTVSRKVGNAVVRNRVKRRLREAIRLEHADAALTGVDVVFIARPAAATVGYAALHDQVKVLLGKVAASSRRSE